MDRAKRCIVILKDDFKNVLILQKKVKRTEPKIWCLLENEVKGKASEEKSIDKNIKKTINSIIFNKEVFKDYNTEGTEDILRVYTGQLKERIVLHKEYTSSKWIGKRELDNIDLEEEHKKILTDFFDSL